MQIIFYKSSNERNFVPKSNKLDTVVTLNGSLRSGTSIMNPTIEIEYDGLLVANYCYIPDFNRYYFIDDIISIRRNIWSVKMSVDVLESYKTEILALQNAKISRSGVESFSNDYRISDKMLPTGDKFSVTLLSNHISIFNNLDGACSWYIITATQQEDSIPTVTGSVAAITYRGANRRLTPMSSAIRIYMYTSNSNFMKDLLEIAKDDTINQYLIEAGAVPFNIVSDIVTVGRTSVSELECGTKKVTAHNAYLLNPNAGLIENSYTLNGVVNIDKCFLDSTKYYLYLPFYGELEIPKHCIFTDSNGRYSIQCFVNLCIDFTNMSITYFVIGERGDVLLTQAISIGVKIPIDRSNLEEVKRNETANMLNLLGSLVSAGALGVASAVTLNPFGLVTAAGAAIGAGISYAARDKTNVEKGNAVFSSNSNLSMLASPNALKLYEIAHYTSVNVSAMFHNNYGFAYDVVGDLADCVGYTVVDDVHLENIPTALNEELDKIQNILKQGIIIGQS